MNVVAMPASPRGTVVRCRTALHHLLWEMTVEQNVSDETMQFVRAAFEALGRLPDPTIETSNVGNLMASLAHASIETLNTNSEYRQHAVKRIATILRELEHIIE
jgi:hypothetical protein